MDTTQKSPGFFSSLLHVPKFADLAKRRIANMQNIILIGMLITIVIFTVFGLMTRAWTSAGIGLGAGAVVLTAFLLLRRGYTNTVSWIVILTIYLVGVFGLLSFSVNMINVIAFSVLIVLAGLLLTPRGVMFTVVLTLVTLYIFPFFRPPAPENFVVVLLGLWIQGFLLTTAASTLKKSFAEIDLSTQNLLNVNKNLEELNIRVEERAHDLELVADVARTVTGNVADLRYMLNHAVETISTRFNLYHAQIYLVNPSRRTLNLSASTGEAGRQLLARGHRLLISRDSLNGRAALEKQAVLVADTAQNKTFLPNPLLPDTRSELTVPLITGDQVIGVLDLQSEQPNAFNEFNLPTFNTLAGQLAIALQNASLFTEMQEARHLAEASTKRTTEQGWEEFLDGIHHPGRFGYVYGQEQAIPLDEKALSLLPPESLAVPILIAGTTVGSIQVPPDEAMPVDQMREILEQTSIQLGRHIENLRLLEQAEQYRAEAEQATRRLTREGWGAYQQNQSEAAEGYIYTKNRVRPLTTPEEEEKIPGIVHPLTVHGEPIGTLELAFPGDAKTIDPQSAELVNTIAETLTTHIEGLRLAYATETALVEVNQRASELGILNQIVVSASATLNMQDLLPTIARDITHLLKARNCEISQLNKKQHSFHMLADYDIETNGPLLMGDDVPIPDNDPVITTIETTKRSIMLPDAKNNPLTLPVRHLMEARNTECLLVAPLLVRGEMIGMIGVGASEPGREFTPSEVRLVETIAGQLAGNLENARLFQEAQQLAKRETIINTINQRIQGAISVESALEIATRELGHLLKTRRAVVEIRASPQNGQ